MSTALMGGAAVAALLLGSGVALASGGSSGGSMPSMSAPAYDPAEEYRNGVAALEAKDYAGAKKAFDRVLRATPKNANANYLAGLARNGLGDVKGSRKYFENAVKYDDKLIPARQELGIAFAKLGESAKAEEQLGVLKAKATECADTCPQAADLKAAIAAVTTAMGQGPQARLDTAPTLIFQNAAAGDSAYLAAVSLINEHRYEDAIASLQAAEHAFGPHPDILTYLGFANRKLKRYDVAESYYLAALEAAPGHRGATEYYGELLLERGDVAGAKAKLAALDAACAFGCAEAEELRRWIAAGGAPAS
ncbi:hypothetical protein ACFB49_17460 [Sphingomonas sp. DBB INV C78]|uniref:tetratricopeptide repeat protein n=1 Tax=Sphingomonas sp. DBB INV C78 TaxID=3349434 RepID=UPI0036D2FF49